MAYKKVIGNYQSNSDFSPDLVGFQITEGSQLFTLSNFFITPTPSTKSDYFYDTMGFSDPITLSNLNLTSSEGSTLIDNNLNLVLNLDESDVFNYTLFGSLREHIKASINKVILEWPGSLYVNKVASGVTTFTAIQYVYNQGEDISKFTIPVANIKNNFLINLEGDVNEFVVGSGDKDLSTNYYKYVLRYPIPVSGTSMSTSPGYFSNKMEYPVIGFVGTTVQSPNYVVFSVKGNPFPSATNGAIMDSFHIKPKHSIVEEYFSKLKGLDRFLLNRDNTPIYTSEFTIPIKGDDETFADTKVKFTWPTTDGYNIDINTVKYGDYFNSLLGLADIYDGYKTDLVSRFFTTEAIKEFDTSDRRVEKLLRLYGREFDEVKRYIDGLAFATRISYDKNNNIPDKLVKNLARTLGFETMDFSNQDDLLESFFGGTTDVVFSGTSVGMTPVEFDIELWRRLVINAGYLFRTKGTRKVIEFFLKFIGAPDSLVEFNEYVYTVKGKLNINNVYNSLDLLDGNQAEVQQDSYAIDIDGYPKVIPNSKQYYFQMKGGWYRETDYIGANNPHFGPYDGGQEYFNKFRKLTDSSGGTFSIPSNVTGTVDKIDLVPMLVSNNLLSTPDTFNLIKTSTNSGGLGYVNGVSDISTGNGVGQSWSTVSNATSQGTPSLYVFDHIGESIPSDKQQLAKDLYDSGYAVLTISEYATTSLYPITNVVPHPVGDTWGYNQNQILDPLNPLTQNWSTYPSMVTSPGIDVISVVSEASIISYNEIPNNDKVNVVQLYNTNGGRWIHVQNPYILNSPDLLDNIMDFLTMRTDYVRGYFDFNWSDFHEQTISVESPGFILHPQIDNRKSWVSKPNEQRDWGVTNSVYSSTTTTRDTNYYVGDDERLVLNTKMVDAHLNPAKAIESDMYNYNKLSGFPITIKYEYNPNINENMWPVVGNPRGYNRQNLGGNIFYGSSMSGSGFAVSATTFAQYMERVKTKFINVKNRKTIGGGGFGFQPNWPSYPTLRNVFESYVSGGTSGTVLGTGVPIVNNLGSNKLTYQRMLGFVDKIQPYWSRLLEQFIPSTTIIGLGVKHTNIVFDRQKYVYKHGHRSTQSNSPDSITTLNSQWYNKHYLVSRNIGPGSIETETEPMVLRNNDGTNTQGGVATAASVFTSGKEYYFRVGVKFVSGLINHGDISTQTSYSIGGKIGDPSNVSNGIPGFGYVNRQGQIFLKDASGPTEDIIINVFGPGYYDVRFTPVAGGSNNLKLVTNINGLIIDSVKLYNVTDSDYVVDNNTSNGNFTEGFEYADYSSIELSRLKYWSGLSGSGIPASGEKWFLEASPLVTWPGTDGSESVTINDGWYCKGTITTDCS